MAFCAVCAPVVLTSCGEENETPNPDDDMFDFTRGYNCELKDRYGIWADGYSSTEEDPRGIETDGNPDGKNPEHAAALKLQSQYRLFFFHFRMDRIRNLIKH